MSWLQLQPEGLQARAAAREQAGTGEAGVRFLCPGRAVLPLPGPKSTWAETYRRLKQPDRVNSISWDPAFSLPLPVQPNGMLLAVLRAGSS